MRSAASFVEAPKTIPASTIAITAGLLGIRSFQDGSGPILGLGVVESHDTVEIRKNQKPAPFANISLEYAL